HGYELIKALEERSGGFYSPSPGMVYPALTYLEEAGLAVVFESDGAKKLYRITPDGEARLKRMGRKMDRVREAFAAEAEDEDLAQDLKAARRELHGLLRDRRRSSPEEQQRIADILKRAIAEIRGQ